jgi:hypothetical protein
MGDKHRSKHIKLTSHPGAGGARPIPIHGPAPAHDELAKAKGRSLVE